MARKVPDHSTWKDVVGWEDKFTEENAAALAKKYGFAGREKALLNKLQYAAYIYQAAKTDSPPLHSEQRKLLDEIKELSASLDEALSKVGPYELRLLLESAPGWNPVYRLKDIILSVHQLKYHADGALNALPPKNGRPKKFDDLYFTKELYEIYVQMSGDERKYTYDPYAADKDSRYIGSQAVKFIGDCQKILNIEMSDANIVRLLKSATNDN